MPEGLLIVIQLYVLNQLYDWSLLVWLIFSSLTLFLNFSPNSTKLSLLSLHTLLPQSLSFFPLSFLLYWMEMDVIIQFCIISRYLLCNVFMSNICIVFETLKFKERFSTRKMRFSQYLPDQCKNSFPNYSKNNLQLKYITFL